MLISDFRLNAVWPWFAATASGVLLALCFAPWNLTPLAWVALGPMICAVWFSRETARPGLRAAQLGYVAGLMFFTAVFYWLGALAAFAWVAHEWVRGWLFSGFGWNALGVTLHADLPMIQIADITGAAGLSWPEV